MRSSSFLLALLSCRAASGASSPTARRRGRSAFVTKAASTSSWNAIPRGGSDDGGSSSAPSMPDMSSLLSGANLPGFGAGGMPDLSKPPNPEEIQRSMEQMTALLSSPQFKEMMADPIKMDEGLEKMRTMLLSALEEMENGNNPMMTMMMEQIKAQVAQAFPGGWEGLKSTIEDPERWKEMTGGLMDAMKSLGEEDLNNLMNQMAGAAMGGGGGLPGMGGMPGGGGMPGMGMGGAGGGFPGMGGNTLGDALGGDASGTLAGLDDLSEGED